MNSTPPVSPPRRRNSVVHRWVRQLHLWIGAWGALAAVLYGFSGLVMNNRFGDSAWPQGNSQEAERVALQVPATVRGTPEELSLWLRQTRNLDAQVIRKGGAGKEGRQPPKWNLSGGTAAESWVLEYVPGQDTAELRRSSHSLMASINRLHKGIGGGWAWNLLADSFALGLLLLGLSGIWLWARGRTPKQMVASVLAVSIAVLVAIAGPALV